MKTSAQGRHLPGLRVRSPGKGLRLPCLSTAVDVSKCSRASWGQGPGQAGHQSQTDSHRGCGQEGRRSHSQEPLGQLGQESDSVNGTEHSSRPPSIDSAHKVSEAGSPWPCRVEHSPHTQALLSSSPYSLIFRTALRIRDYCCAHFIGEETEAKGA